MMRCGAKYGAWQRVARYMTAKSTDDRGELALIRRLKEELDRLGAPRAPAGIPFGDDMAGVQVGAMGLLATTDMLMDGTDFVSGEHSWFDIGRKAMAVNLSDVAAMAAVPVAALIAGSLNDGLSMGDALALFRGAAECGRDHGCPLVGGDTNSWQHPTVIAITVIARPDEGLPAVRRDGARPGDVVYVTGPMGGSILGRHMHPCPRVDTARRINRELGPRAMVDISDGLARDLGHIIEASGCGAELDEVLLEPLIHPDAVKLAERTGRAPLEHVLHDGEDFELVVALPPSVEAGRAAELGLTRIGRVVEEPALMLVGRDGARRTVERRGWEHFT